MKRRGTLKNSIAAIIESENTMARATGHRVSVLMLMQATSIIEMMITYFSKYSFSGFRKLPTSVCLSRKDFMIMGMGDILLAIAGFLSPLR